MLGGVMVLYHVDIVYPVPARELPTLIITYPIVECQEHHSSSRIWTHRADVCEDSPRWTNPLQVGPTYTYPIIVDNNGHYTRCPLVFHSNTLRRWYRAFISGCCCAMARLWMRSAHKRFRVHRHRGAQKENWGVAGETCATCIPMNG